MLLTAAGGGLRIRELDLGYRHRAGESKLRTLRDGMRHLQLIVLLAPHILLVWPGLMALVAGLGLGVLSIVEPDGLTLGSLRWQPIFFGPILIVVGTLASMAGAAIANRSPLVGPNVARHFDFAEGPRFARRSLAAGLALLGLGLAIDLALFLVWVSGSPSSPRALGLAGLAQAFIITGTAIAGFGFIDRLLGLRNDYRGRRGDLDVAQLSGDFLRAG